MPGSSVLMTSTSPDAVTDGSTGNTTKPGVSDFLTVQSFTNFAAVSGAITAAWHAVHSLNATAFGAWFPYACAFLWATISYQISKDGLGKDDGTGTGTTTVPWGTTGQALFFAFINALVLAGSVVGTTGALKGVGP
jgi:hypothetical protein